LAGKYREDRRFPTLSDSFCLKTVSRMGLLDRKFRGASRIEETTRWHR